MGELIDGGASLSGAGSLISMVFSLLALGVYALNTNNRGNDDDDSTPGGGLMQPVA